MTRILRLPLDEIDAEALPRDRGALRGAAFEELADSILRHGLRLPVEVCPLEGARPWGLVSGYRRLAAFRRLAGQGVAACATIPALCLAPEDMADALRMMVEENSVRAPVAPWDRGRILVEAVARGHFPTLDEAVERLHPAASRQKRARLRAVADAVDWFAGHLTAPEHLSERRLLRLAAALRGGYGEVMAAALRDLRERGPRPEWRLLDAILREAEAETRGDLPPDPRPGRPRRRVRLRPTLTIRREMTAEGWSLRLAGPDATGALAEDIMDEVERLFGREA